MTPRALIAAALVVIAALVALVCAIGVWRVDDDLPRVHVQGPLTAFCVPMVALAIALDAPLTPAMVKALLLGTIALVLTPVVTHATARAAHHRAGGKPRSRPEPEVHQAPAEQPPAPHPEAPAP